MAGAVIVTVVKVEKAKPPVRFSVEAIAILEEQGFWGTLSFVDYFSLARFDSEWKIVNKTFAQTGGSMPPA